MASSLDDLLRRYFLSWRPYNLILARLSEVHKVKRSLRWLKMQFKRLGLSRRAHNSVPSVQVVKNCIRRELQTSNSLVGYRSMWKCLREKYHLHLSRDAVMLLMREIDPDNVRQRSTRRLKRRVYSSKGPNFTWHIDQYDKLSAFGFCFHGCIDGFSRRIIWLKVASTNRDSHVILGYYLEAVGHLQGCPQIVRMDRGTENSEVARFQIVFRMSHADNLAAEKSIRYGSSPSNSRMESWWSKFRIMKMHWWIETLKKLERDGWFDGDNEVHRKCMAVVFLPVIQREADRFVSYWNSHHIRPTRTASCPSGRPDDMYDMPIHYGAQNCLQPLNQRLYNHARMQATAPPPHFDNQFFDTCNELTTHVYGIDLFRDITPSNCIQVYKYLVNNIRL